MTDEERAQAHRYAVEQRREAQELAARLGEQGRDSFSSSMGGTLSGSIGTAYGRAALGATTRGCTCGGGAYTEHSPQICTFTSSEQEARRMAFDSPGIIREEYLVHPRMGDSQQAGASGKMFARSDILAIIRAAKANEDNPAGEGRAALERLRQTFEVLE